MNSQRPILLALMLTVLAGCKPWWVVADPGEQGKSGSARTVETVVRSSGWSEALREQQVQVITTRMAFAGLWSRLHASPDPKPPMPEIDFSKESVVAAMLGERATGGFEVEITGITDQGSTSVISVREVKPGPECFVSEAFTSPFHVVKTGALKPETEIRWSADIRTCR